MRGMVDFVLVPGAWLGAWAWDEVAEVLRAEGHGVYAVTLSGLAERHGPGSAQVGQQEHVDDIVSVVEGNDLHDVVLAGSQVLQTGTQPLCPIEGKLHAGIAEALLDKELLRLVVFDEKNSGSLLHHLSYRPRSNWEVGIR